MYLTMSQEVPRRHREETMHATEFERNIRVRWGLSEDEPRIGELLDLNGVPRWPAMGEQFLVAEEDGEVLAVMGYRTAPKRLLLDAVIADPWAGERDLAVALYARARDLAHGMGVRKILARSDGRTNYPRQAGYRRRLGVWRLAALPPTRGSSRVSRIGEGRGRHGRDRRSE
jgi:N-acetylglutamate synthase-like GNAT family acetyltransferase